MVPSFLEKGYEVTVLDNFMFQQNSLMECCADNTFSVVHGDARDEGLLTSVIADKDYIIPLAVLV